MPEAKEKASKEKAPEEVVKEAVAKQKKAEEKAAEEALAAVQPEQFMNTNDWPLWRPKALFRVKQLDAEDPDKHTMVSEDMEVTVVSQEELFADFEPVKGLHKREF